MSLNFDRRKFMLGCAAATAATGGVGSPGKHASAIEPIARNGSHKFKLSLAAYSYRDLLTGDPAELTLADFVDDCAKMNLDATELTSYYFPADTTDADLRKLKQQCFHLGLSVSGTAVGNDFGFPPGAERDRQIADVKRWIDRAEVLGAPVIRIFAGKPKQGQSQQQTHDLMVEGIEACCQYAGEHGIHLALENHGGPTSTAEGVLSFVRDVRSPWFGVNLDSGNFYYDDPYTDLAKIAPYALNVQVKVVTSNNEERTNKQPTDYDRLARILKDSNYRGYIVLEYEEAGDPRTECPKHLAEIRKAFA
ncbi:sugar phosphate isomerase/epimerase family protein [Adhaeretor mobilis]|uniref:3-dehydroshikimate dehydratase n=1 Tax=Adhaeretor mobilis TaxID=1930276 RepID=A0A517N108_9BACT|nr:sugar phosphate isomerase/epimerase family protein [Adhaeretor mobilis]QDT00816.1 3-dehydroshikimate dehydratase [Adhaeretor mobilis]